MTEGKCSSLAHHRLPGHTGDVGHGPAPLLHRDASVPPGAGWPRLHRLLLGHGAGELIRSGEEVLVLLVRVCRSLGVALDVQLEEGGGVEEERGVGQSGQGHGQAKQRQTF